jgi:hypothetical protein
MIDVHLHLRGQPVAERSFASIPMAGELLDVGGLWRVAGVILGVVEADVYVVKVEGLAGELAGWADKPAQVEPEAAQQRGLFT